MRPLIILILLSLGGCGLPHDIVGPVDPGSSEMPPRDCPTPAPDSGVDQPPC